MSSQFRDPAIDIHLAAEGTALGGMLERGQDWIVVRRDDETIAMIIMTKVWASCNLFR